MTHGKNKLKYETYRENLGRYKKAVSNRFYLEALWILYAMAEDRLSSFLYHMGFVRTDDRRKVIKKLRPDIRKILLMKESDKRYGFDNISGKMGSLRKILKLLDVPVSDSGFAFDVGQKAAKIRNLAELRKALDDIDTWRDERNKLAHSLFNSGYTPDESKLVPQLKETMNAIREIDRSVGFLRRGTDIRKKYNLQ